MAKLSSLDIYPLMYKRYVDDVNMAMYILKPGLRFIEGKMVIIEEEVDNDRDGAEDKRVAIEMRKIANTIMPRSVEMEEDVPSNHSNRKLPILDMEMWW